MEELRNDKIFSSIQFQQSNLYRGLIEFICHYVDDRKKGIIYFGSKTFY